MCFIWYVVYRGTLSPPLSPRQVVTDMGLTPLLARWCNLYLTPLSHILYPGEEDGRRRGDSDAGKDGKEDDGKEGEREGDIARGPFSSIHAFTIRYSLGEDTDLKEHIDDADLTLNICLGTVPFEGAHVYVCFRRRGMGDDELVYYNEMSQYVYNKRCGDELCHVPPSHNAHTHTRTHTHTHRYFKPVKPSDESTLSPPSDVTAGAAAPSLNPVRVLHAVGSGLVHRGDIRHGTEQLTAGVRSNIVIWCRHRPPRPGQAPDRLDIDTWE